MIQIIDLIFNALYFALLIRILLSWFPHSPYHPLIQILHQVTDPILNPFKQIIPPVSGLDFSPIVAFLAIQVAHSVVIGILI